jgi:tetratricopeptide (TPR) repeat protein
MTRQYENAVFRLEECLELAPDDFEALVLSGFAFTEMKKFDVALECYENALLIQPHSETIAMNGYTLAKMNRVSEAENAIKLLESIAESSMVPRTFFAIIYAALGDIENAFTNLETALAEKYLDLVALRVDPRWDNIRFDPRFEEICAKIGV